MMAPTEYDFDAAGAGFRPDFDPASLRRHLRMSLSVVIILAGAIAGAVTTVGTIPVTRSAAGVTIPAAPVSADAKMSRAVRS